MNASVIVYTGFGELIDGLRSRFHSQAQVRSEFKETLNLPAGAYSPELEAADLLLIGPYSADPIRLAQKAVSQNKLVSAIIFTFPEQFTRVKQTIRFAPNIGNTISSMVYSTENSVIPVLENAILRTRQRRSFSKIRQQTQPVIFQPRRPLQMEALNGFFEHIPMACLLLNMDHQVISSNTAANRLFNISFNGKTSLTDILPQYENKRDLPGPQVVQLQQKHLEISASEVFDQDEKQGYILLFNDITEKVISEKKLNEKVEELEIANLELDQFVNVVSHDFKTPITSISLLCDLLIRGQDAERQQEFIRKIKTSSNQLKELMKGLEVLVDVKKAQTEKVKLLRFEEELKFMTDQYQLLLDKSGAEISHDFTAAPEICYLEAHLKSLLSNLISNAIKYRQKDVPLKIELETRREREFIILSIKDNGIGIDLTKNMDKLFQPFKRFTSQASGTGLGLSLIKRMVELNGGYLEVYSTPGEGTRFVVFLKEYKA
ncbi:MAG TPA: HAMP domain-containing sensor histidine kinase [Sphingobacteriaceae bacterium]